MGKDVIVALDFDSKEKTLAFLDRFTEMWSICILPVPPERKRLSGLSFRHTGLHRI